MPPLSLPENVTNASRDGAECTMQAMRAHEIPLGTFEQQCALLDNLAAAIRGTIAEHYNKVVIPK
jgi:hypothetical protein